jgi:Amidohydrolase
MAATIDAYAHIGYPRFGTPDELIAVWLQWGIKKGNIVLPPGMPDFHGLERARQALGKNVRLFGIPYGPEPGARAQLAEIQIRFGIAGMRLMPDEIADNPDVLSLLGESGLFLMAINLYDRADVTRIVLEWLERYPNGAVASPHFLRVGTIDGSGVADPGAFRELLKHPRMHAIFSRHGGCSREQWPHADLRPWVDDVLPLLGWDRVMWGSEIPVIYHRDEQVDGVRDWLSNLGVRMSCGEEAAYLGGNAQRVFFDPPAGAVSSRPDLTPATGEPIRFPGWVQQGLQAYIDANDPVPVVRTDALHLPLDLHGVLTSRYLVAQRSRPTLTFQHFLVEVLRQCESIQQKEE